MLPLNSIVCCDCVEGMASLPDEAIPLTVTSPPYDRVRDFGSWDFERTGVELFRVTRPGGVVCWQVQDAIEDGRRTLTSFRQALHFERVGFHVWDVLIIVSRCYMLPNNRRYFAPFSYCFVLSRGRPTTVNILKDRPNKHAGRLKGNWHRRRSDGSMRRGKLPAVLPLYGRRTTVWEYKTGFNMTTKDREAFAHPALMPEALARDLIVSFSCPYDVVLDPFAGAGTTVKMALLTGRRWLGFEINPEYVALAHERLRKAERQLWAS